MRGLIQYLLFSGAAWFLAGAIFLLGILLDLIRIATPQNRVGRAAQFLLVLAIPLAVLSGTPLPWWFTSVLGAVSIAYALFGFGRRNVPLIVAAALMVSAALAHEARFFFARPGSSARPGRIVVVGDSLSSGGFGEQLAWPQILARGSGIAIENLAQPAETTASAVVYVGHRLREPPGQGETVIVEIGGNDLLGGTSWEAFELYLDRLLTIASAGGRRRVVMFELPLLPGKWMYGSAQRRLARKHGVELIPKRVLAKLLTSPENVLDDALHLSQTGHQRLASEIRRWLKL